MPKPLIAALVLLTLISSSAAAYIAVNHWHTHHSAQQRWNIALRHLALGETTPAQSLLEWEAARLMVNTFGAMSACSFDARKAAWMIKVPDADLPWSVTLYDSDYNLMAAYDETSFPGNGIEVRVRNRRGFAFLEVLAPDEVSNQLARTSAARLRCAPQ